MSGIPEQHHCRTQYFQVHGTDISEILSGALCSPDFNLYPLFSNHERNVFYDTFDWHAFDNGIAVVKKKNSLSLVSLETGTESQGLPFPGYPSAFFASDLPESPLMEQLSAVCEIRALLKYCTLDRSLRAYRVTDDNEKTIALLTAESLIIVSEKKRLPFSHILSLRSLKGYQEETETFRKLLSRHSGLDQSLGFRELFILLLEAAGHQTQGYSSKISQQLDPLAPVYESARKLLQSTLSIMKANEKGIRNNIDSEFLHDYRVALRRTRSIMKQLKGVFDPDETAPFLEGFRELGKNTNELRDCDVYILRRKTYADALPTFLQPPLENFFAEIEKSRKSFHRKFCRHLASENYRQFLQKWESFLCAGMRPDPQKAPKASLSTIDAASGAIRKAWKQVIRTGRLIGVEAADQDLHTLRIKCKKLRYLLEFFASIYPRKTIGPVIRQLKELQENLGTFVDLSVQIRFLSDRLQHTNKSIDEPLYSASIGGLVSILHFRKEEARTQFGKTFETFDNSRTRQLFREMLFYP